MSPYTPRNNSLFDVTDDDVALCRSSRFVVVVFMELPLASWWENRSSCRIEAAVTE